MLPLTPAPCRQGGANATAVPAKRHKHTTNEEVTKRRKLTQQNAAPVELDAQEETSPADKETMFEKPAITVGELLLMSVPSPRYP